MKPEAVRLGCVPSSTICTRTSSRGVWQPVEVLINRVVTMLYGDRSQSGVITGERLLRDDHFEFRGASPRPSRLAARSAAG